MRSAPLFQVTIVESSNDAIIGKQLDGTIVSWNKGAERMFGYTEAEMVGASVLTLIPPSLRDEEPAIIARIVKGERVDHYETQRRRKDGTLIDVSISVSPILDNQGAIIGAAKIARDITEAKRTQAELRVLNERLEEQALELEEQASELEEKATELNDQLAESSSMSRELETANRELKDTISVALNAQSEAET